MDDDDDDDTFEDVKSVEPLGESVEVGGGSDSACPTSSSVEGRDEEDPTQHLLRRGVSEPSLVAPPASPPTRPAHSTSCLRIIGTLLHLILVEARAPLLLAFGQLALLAAVWRRTATEQQKAGLSLPGAVGLTPPEDPKLAVAHIVVCIWLVGTLAAWTVSLLLAVKRNRGVAEHGTGAYVSYVIAFKNGQVHLLAARAGLVSVLVCAAVGSMHLSKQSATVALSGAELCVALVLGHALCSMQQSGGSAAFVVDMGSSAPHETGAFARARLSRRVLWQHGCGETVRQLSVLIAHGKVRDTLVWDGGYQINNCALKPGQVTAEELDMKHGGAHGRGTLDQSCEASTAPASSTSSFGTGVGIHAGTGSSRGAHKPYRYVSVPGSSAGVRWRVLDECQVYSKSGGSWADAIVTDITVAARPATVTVRYCTAQGREMVKTLAQDSELIRPRLATDTSIASSTPPRSPVTGQSDVGDEAGGPGRTTSRRAIVTFSNGKSPGRVV